MPTLDYLGCFSELEIYRREIYQRNNLTSLRQRVKDSYLKSEKLVKCFLFMIGFPRANEVEKENRKGLETSHREEESNHCRGSSKASIVEDLALSKFENSAWLEFTDSFVSFEDKLESVGNDYYDRRYQHEYHESEVQAHTDVRMSDDTSCKHIFRIVILNCTTNSSISFLIKA